MSQLCHRLQAAVAVLVSHTVGAERLEALTEAHGVGEVTAYARHLQDLERHALPDEIREDFSRLREALHQHRPVCGETAVEATVRKMAAHEADGHAAAIVQMLVSLLQADPAAERFRVVDGQADSAAGGEPPAFLARRS